MEQKKERHWQLQIKLRAKATSKLKCFYKRKNIKTLNVILRATEKHGSSFESHQKNEVY